MFIFKLKLRECLRHLNSTTIFISLAKEPITITIWCIINTIPHKLFLETTTRTLSTSAINSTTTHTNEFTPEKQAHLLRHAPIFNVNTNKCHIVQVQFNKQSTTHSLFDLLWRIILFHLFNLCLFWNWWL